MNGLLSSRLLHHGEAVPQGSSDGCGHTASTWRQKNELTKNKNDGTKNNGKWKLMRNIQPCLTLTARRPKKGSKFLAKLVMNYFSNLFYIFVGLLKHDSMMIPDHFKLGRIATGVFGLFMVVGSTLMLPHAHKLKYNETILVVFNPPIWIYLADYSPRWGK